jgi:hypothetical protein
MSNSHKHRLFVYIFSLLAGAMDSTTVLFLIVAPETTLKWMGISSPGYSLELIRFIGAFVLAVGSIYLWALWWSQKHSSWTILIHAWMGTAWVRICVGVVTSLMIFEGSLSSEWASVPVIDFIFAIFQISWVSSRVSAHHA